MINLNKLKNIDTPARYTGGEARQYIKNIKNVDARVCVSVPAMYEIGMFDFDQKAIYYELNKKKNIWCERAFAPMPDFEALLKQEKETLYTLESKTKLNEMDVIVFVISNELMYTNLINMLSLSNIPIFKSLRTDKHPLIIASGSAINNPKPLEDFVDMYIIGDSSLIIGEVLDKIVLLKNESKEKILITLKDMKGVYVPNYTTKQIDMLKSQSIECEKYPSNLVIPSVQTILDKAIVTLAKGCDKNCIMCTQKYLYGTPEHLSVDKSVIRTKEVIRATGNLDVMLMINCYSNHPELSEIIYRLNDLERPKIKNISFMDVKLDLDNLWLLKHMNNKDEYPGIIVGAPTEVLRSKIGISITNDSVFEIARKVFESGFNKIKLQYIIGIPTETYEDLGAILDTANKICKIYKEVYSKSPDKYIVEINIINFKAKPHTPSQWCTVNSSENLELKLRYLNEKNKNENVIIRSENTNQTVIETMLSRGDKIIGQVIYEAWLQGARHDMLPSMFSMESWQVALNKKNVDLKKYLEEINEKLVLPWDNINVGTTKEELRRRYINQVKGG